MDRIEPAVIATMVLSAPVWVRLGIAVPDERLRERAADALAARIVQGLHGPVEPDARQLSLPIVQVAAVRSSSSDLAAKGR